MFNSIRFCLKFRVALVSMLVLLTVLTPPATIAQAPSSSPAEPARPKPRSHLTSAVVEKHPSLPNMPVYTSKYLRYVSGIKDFGLNSNESYDLQYQTAEPSDQVLNWYKSALESKGYTISQKTKDTVMATNQSAGVAVLLIVMPDSQPGFSPNYKTHFNLRYIKGPAVKPQTSREGAGQQ